MSAPINPYADVLVWFILALVASCIVLLAFTITPKRRRPVDEPPLRMPPTLAAHIARQMVADLDAEWEDLQRQIGGTA